jgi:hypothetical protein
MGTGLERACGNVPSVKTVISVIIPAHNESSTIGRTLQAIIGGAQPGELDVIVVCNGCCDDTAAVARRFGPRVRVIETDISAKSHALNLGDAAAYSFPRIYADADVIITIDTIRALARRLDHREALAVAPTAHYELTGCSWPVRACYEIRSLLPSSQEGIGGSGVYALSAAGRGRFTEFPRLTADDGYVRIQFRPHERETITTAHSTVFPPRTLKHLIATKTRAHYGSCELNERFPETWRNNRGESNHGSLLRLFRNPGLWPKLAIYGLVTVIAKRRARKQLRGAAPQWQRDNTSRATA